jgi:hypothetical protein
LIDNEKIGDSIILLLQFDWWWKNW